MRHVILPIVLSAALAALACSGDSKSETETHFLSCKTDGDCRKLGAAFSCVERQCREGADAGQGSGGSSAGGASSGGGTTSASGGEQAGGAGGLTSGGAGAGTGGGGGAGSCGDPGEPCCDPFPGDGPNYCNGEYRCNGNVCVDCDCALGAYVPVCGTDEQTYDRACGRVCVPVEIACEGECPCVAPPACPSEPPQQGAPCSGGTSCFYERCSTYGRIQAQCSGSTWTVQTGACSEAPCGLGSLQCAAGQACVIRQGGAFLADCMPSSCDGLVACDCVDGCLAGCALAGDVGTGVTVTCNTCPQGGCP